MFKGEIYWNKTYRMLLEHKLNFDFLNFILSITFVVVFRAF